ncbi:hypothetical protein P153DRAFT_364826 [Dothidotthia symphoricarpi CBS 119687]|uniref:Uncharacterized protein n=1 Tax=Dothidotthia symphoricarpi CBS 119687 TaxID=1392245 RepID=A0A6A6AMM2_9PLEO|nr:uncharacterized protein P153DRAFT_364826 [Dothidotthia symphoricarpi CBS 119687]KAF2132423.1 hypothetical protein P153DRAFT_364826 [Dothidotthia symphoricarpi CBS 119687]
MKLIALFESSRVEDPRGDDSNCSDIQSSSESSNISSQYSSNEEDFGDNPTSSEHNKSPERDISVSDGDLQTW